MGVNIKSVKGYYRLDVWVMANIIQLATFKFAKRFVTKDIDPCGRLFDQMTQAARSVTANIAEGASRAQTSVETQMRLTDVARASLSELLGDFFFLSMYFDTPIWSAQSENYRRLKSIQLDRANYQEDWEAEAWKHVMAQKAKFEQWVNHNHFDICVNSLMQLCNRCATMLQKLMERQHGDFIKTGGFTENMTADRLTALKNNPDAPKCPKCGKPMVKRTAQKGVNAGHEFWSCSGYPECRGTRSI